MKDYRDHKVYKCQKDKKALASKESLVERKLVMQEKKEQLLIEPLEMSGNK